MAVLRADDDDKDVALILIETLLGEERGKWKMRLGGLRFLRLGERKEEERWELDDDRFKGLDAAISLFSL